MKTYKITIVVLIALLAFGSCELIDDVFSNNSNDSGIDVQTYTTSIPDIIDVFFINKSVGYAVGYEGMIKKTSDGGRTWNSQESGTSLNLTTVFFINENIGFATGAYTQCPEDDCNKSGIFLKTTNGGEKWQKELKPDIAFFYDLYFFDENIGIGILLTMEDGKYAAKTEDAGKTWDYLNLKVPDNIMFLNHYSIEQIFSNDNVCYILGDERKIYKSTDLFITWETYNVPLEIERASFISSELAFITDNKTIYRTNNGGKNWSKLPTPEDPVGFNHFFDERNGFSIHYNTEYPPLGDFPQAVSTKIYFTSDGGKTWRFEEHPEVISGHKSFPTNNIVYYVNEKNTYVLKLK